VSTEQTMKNEKVLSHHDAMSKLYYALWNNEIVPFLSRPEIKAMTVREKYLLASRATNAVFANLQTEMINATLKHVKAIESEASKSLTQSVNAATNKE